MAEKDVIVISSSMKPDSAIKRKITTPNPNYPAYKEISKVISDERDDYDCGGGNCLFRAVNKVIRNSESGHEELRKLLVVDFIKDNVEVQMTI